MKKYKILVSDYDGTLAGSDNKISKANLSAINGFISRGGIFVLSSGRATDGISKILLSQGFKGLLSSFNGAVLYDLSEQKILKTKCVPTETLLKFINYASAHNLYYHFYEESGFNCPFETARTKLYEKLTGVMHIVIENPYEYVMQKGIATPKILVFEDEEVLDEHFEAFKALLPECEVVRSTENMIDINLKGVDKGFSLDMIAEYFEVSIDDIVAVGDAGNDYKMIEKAGLSVAVANATEEIKNEADIVLPVSNDEDGVKYLIDNYCI